MLTIRREQMEVLGAYMRQSFEDRLVQHIAQSFPAQFRKLAPPPGNDEPVRTLIKQGIERAGDHGITSERDVRRFIDLMVTLGPDFETKADTAWAQSILRDKTLPARVRMELIHQQLAARSSPASGASDPRAQ
jgi:hypothetical protein